VPGAGGITAGEVADRAVCDDDPFDDGARVVETWVAGKACIESPADPVCGTAPVKRIMVARAPE
jgi:hypothetical protein